MEYIRKQAAEYRGKKQPREWVTVYDLCDPEPRYYPGRYKGRPSYEDVITGEEEQPN